MKKLLTLAALLGAASLSFAQGTVNFSAGATVASRIATNSVVGGPSTGLISGSTFYFALFVAPSTTTSWTGIDPTLSGFTFTGAIGTNGAAGRFSGNPDANGTVISQFATSATASFTVVGWSGNMGTTWASALSAYESGMAGFWGSSGVAQVQLGGGAIPAGNIFGANPGQISGFTAGVVPEPSTFALAGLGAAALMIFRRRK